MMTEDDLNSIRAAHLDGRPDSTHWGECHLAHPHCAIAALLSDNERLRTTIERYLEAVTSGEDATSAWDELVQTVW